MAFNFSVSAAPQVELTRNGAKALAATEMTVLVKTNTDFVPVACLSMVGVPLIVLVCYVVPWGIKILFMIYDWIHFVLVVITLAPLLQAWTSTLVL